MKRTTLINEDFENIHADIELDGKFHEKKDYITFYEITEDSFQTGIFHELFKKKEE